MNPKFQRFAPYGLYLAGVALLIAVGFYIVQQQFSTVVKIGLAVAILGLAANILLDPEGARQMFTGRQARYGSNALLFSVAILGIVIVANFLAYKNDKRWDLTENRENSLAPESIDTLAKLPAPVVARAFYVARDQTKSTGEDLLKLFVQNSAGKFTYEIVDPEADPILAQQAGVTRTGDIILVMGERQEKASVISEQGITGALVRLMSAGKRTIYFTTGHGEFNPDQAGDRSYSQIKRTLESKNYVIKTVNLLTVESLPEDAETVVVAGPTKPLAENEVGLLKSFTSMGGGLFILVDPTVFTQAVEQSDPLLDYLSQDLGIVLNDDLIIDLVGQQQLNQPLFAIGANYGSHPITQGLGNFATGFPQARSISLKEAAAGISPVEVVFTQDQSWAETDLADLVAGGQPQPNEGVDKYGPLALMVVAEDFNNGARLAVVGDADFVADDYLLFYGNSDLFINSLDWVVGQEELIQLTPKPNTQRSLNLPPVPYITGLIVLFGIFILPGSMLAIGIGVAISRRRRS